ncbi:MAG: AbrB/MazE/SpoVT family DNA-binding domain-containing protein [Methylovirgula sp.]
MTALKLCKIGNSVGLVLPKEVLGQMNAQVGDTVHLTKTVGGVRLTTYDPAFEEQIKAMRTVMRENRNVLRELAK